MYCPTRFLSLAVRVALLFAVLAPLTSCAKTTVAGVIITFDIDRSSSPLLDPDTLHVTITSSGGKTALDWCYPVSEPASAWFPKTVSVASNGSPTESFHLTAAVLKGGVTLARVDNEVYEVPTSRVAQFSVVFSASCSAQVSTVKDPAHGADCPDGVGQSLCPSGETCSPKTGTCVSDVICLGSGCAGVDGSSTSGSGASNDVGDSGPPTDEGSLADQAESGLQDSLDASLFTEGDSSPDSAPNMSPIEAGPDGGDASTMPPSCAPGGPGMTDCRPGEGGTESCCTSLEVTGGMFFRTYSSDADGGVYGDADPATVSSFKLDKYLVTVGRFRQFVTAWNGGSGWTPPEGSGKHTYLNGGMGLNATGGGYEQGWEESDNSSIAPTDENLACEADATWTPAPANQESLPINCVDWYEAAAFCIWDGGFLPSETEWEYAAAGGNQQREYPWGETDPGTQNLYAIYGCYYPNGAENNQNCTGVVNYAPVGTPARGAGLWGQLDLEGEVYEWVLDWFQVAYVNPCSDCAVVTMPLVPSPPGKVQRSAPLNSGMDYLYPWLRTSSPPQAQGLDSLGDIGFRCARAP